MISVSVLGIRFDQFPPSIHTKFSFTEEQLASITIKLRKQTRSDAVIVLSTCDRVELWCENPKIAVKEPFLRALSLPVLTWSEHTYSIIGEDAIDHLFSLTCGLLSPLYGEDQIISQVHTSLFRWYELVPRWYRGLQHNLPGHSPTAWRDHSDAWLLPASALGRADD